MRIRSCRASEHRISTWWPATVVFGSVIAVAGCSAPPGAVPADDGSDVPEFSGVGSPGAQPGSNGAPPPAPGATGVTDPSGSVPPANNGGGEQNGASGAPLAPSTPSGSAGSANAGANDGAAGSSMVPPPAGNQGAGGAGMGGGDIGAGDNGAGDNGNPPPLTPPPVAPDDPSADEVEAFLGSLPCGAQYSAFGDGGWQFCLRLADGGAACTRGSATFERVTFAGGAAVTNVAQVSGQRDSGVGVVTTAGALHVGGLTSIDPTPLIASGVVNYSAGFNASAALIEQGDGFGILSWTGNGAPAPVTLPGGAQPVQVSANYGLACALSSAGEVFCWTAGGNHSIQGLTEAPTRMQIARPLQMISTGQNGVCGVSFGDTLECFSAWYDNPFLPTEGNAPNFQVRQSTFPSVRSVHIGYSQGIVVRSDGTAAFLPGGAQPPSDNPGQPFTGVTNVVAAGGDRGSACVLTESGSVFCRSGNAVAQATLGGAPLTAQAAACPL